MLWSVDALKTVFPHYIKTNITFIHTFLCSLALNMVFPHKFLYLNFSTIDMGKLNKLSIKYIYWMIVRKEKTLLTSSLQLDLQFLFHLK